MARKGQRKRKNNGEKIRRKRMMCIDRMVKRKRTRKHERDREKE